MKDCGWSAQNRQMIEFAFRLYGGPQSTKFILEDQFNHLQHLVRQQNKGRSYMAKPTQYFYAATSPILRTAKLPGPTVLFPTFQEAFANKAKATADAEAIHKPGKHKLPEFFGRKEDIAALKRYWKAAGYFANRVATAATMYLVDDERTSWSNASRAWAGEPLLLFVGWFQPRKVPKP